MLLVRCPKCANTMKTAPKRVITSVKRCVYCGHSFRIHPPANTRIVAQSSLSSNP